MDRKEVGVALALCVAGCALLLPGRAAAEESKVLFKCVDAKGVTSIQAKPCGKGMTEVWKRDAQTEPKPTQADIDAAKAREARNQQEVVRQSVELEQRLAPKVATPTPAMPPAGSHLAGATNPKEGSQLAPVPVEEPLQPQAITVNNCQAAQAFASAVREKTWIGLTDDQMRRIYGWVQDQCRVQTQSNE
jgi:hypothetical protein